MRFTRTLVSLLAALLSLPAAALAAEGGREPEIARGTHGMIAAAEPFAAEAGLEILRQGGNAVDAAVAVAFALAVTNPRAGNLGGGGFMLIRLADGRSVLIDYRETAPAAARPDMYLDADGSFIPGSSTHGWRSAGIPGTVAGLDLALRKYGTLSLAQVLKPAIRLADKGFPVSDGLAASLQDEAARLSADPESRHIFLRNTHYYQPGEILEQKDLARTLKEIAKHGAPAFYDGSLAKRFVRASELADGLFTLDDLRNYRAVERQPLRGSFHGYEILTAPPPSSGGVALLEALNMLETLLTPDSRPEQPETLHLEAEAMRRAFADRARYLADPDFATVPVEGLISKDYAAACAAAIDPKHAADSAHLKAIDPARFGGAAPAHVEPLQGEPAIAGSVPRHESSNTTHFSVIDAAGNAVANTYTLNDSYGNGITVPGLGFLLNNEMDDFTTNPGHANALFALVQSDANKVEPGKRPSSSMTPTIVLREGEPVLALGAAGGPRIVTALIETLLNRFWFGDDLPLAIARPRFHHQWVPDRLFLEMDGFTKNQVEALRALGHNVEDISTLSPKDPSTYIARLNAVGRDPETGELLGVADGRGKFMHGVARGY